ncbi:hypothetical protein EYC80_005550 [Monilinia laxa]|uniref:Uncharacterized protein n=1 Tax=Monilinia laxa TaxID=61186 RepID=A0A5N6KFL7_MONLA|nr:hypothetical protein EYC80_005550 [Monilinia laxa]
MLVLMNSGAVKNTSRDVSIDIIQLFPPQLKLKDASAEVGERFTAWPGWQGLILVFVSSLLDIQCGFLSMERKLNICIREKNRKCRQEG